MAGRYSLGLISSRILCGIVLENSQSSRPEPQKKALASKSIPYHYHYVKRSSQSRVADDGPSASGYYSDPPLLVLASLADGPKHGHAMIADIFEMCGTRLGPGTLYGAITRLENEGLIEPLPPEDRRYPYRITRRGRGVLHAKLATLRRFSVLGLKRLEAT
jgi:hypothetical protein